MQVFLRPGTIEAISFDLDDTLYDNRPIIAAAEGALLEWLAKEYPGAAIGRLQTGGR